MNRYDAPPNADSQCGRILRLLQANAGAWVPLPEILALKISQYGTRIKELRDEWGFTIENRIETVNGGRHSWFRLVNEPAAGRPISTQPEPSRFGTADEPAIGTRVRRASLGQQNQAQSCRYFPVRPHDAFSKSLSVKPKNPGSRPWRRRTTCQA